MLKKIDYFFFEDQGTIKDRIYFYGTLAFLIGAAVLSLVVVKL